MRRRNWKYYKDIQKRSKIDLLDRRMKEKDSDIKKTLF